jgi:hypothetical protein
MDPIVKDIKTFFCGPSTNACVYNDDSLRLLVRRGRVNKDETHLGFRDYDANISDDLNEAYSGGYGPMDDDENRNEYFNETIKHESNKGVHNWLEIGPGASACLTSMVLGAHPRNTIFAIEARRDSAVRARMILETRFPGRDWDIVEGFAGQVRLPPSIPFDGLVAEILGHIASNEGYIDILHKCADRYGQRLKQINSVIPRYFGTRIVPVTLTDGVFKVAKMNPKMTLFDHFSMSDSQLCSSNEHVDIESYDAMVELQTTTIEAGMGPRLFDGTCTVIKPAVLHGFVLYTFYGNDKNNLKSVADHNANSNWSMIFLPLPGTTLTVNSGDRIHFGSKMYVNQIEPRYEIVARVGDQEFHFDFEYADILTKHYTLTDAREDAAWYNSEDRDAGMVKLWESNQPPTSTKGRKKRRIDYYLSDIKSRLDNIERFLVQELPR